MSSSLLPTVYPTWCDIIAKRSYPPHHAPEWPAGMSGKLVTPLASYSHRNGYVPLCRGRPTPVSNTCPDLGHALSPEWLVYNERPCTM